MVRVYCVRFFIRMSLGRYSSVPPLWLSDEDGLVPKGTQSACFTYSSGHRNPLTSLRNKDAISGWITSKTTGYCEKITGNPLGSTTVLCGQFLQVLIAD